MGKTNRNSVEYCFNHTKIRMLQRHNLDITLEEYEALCTLYNSKWSITVLNTEKDQCVFETEFKHKKFKFVWCDKRKTITTVF